MHKLVLDPPPSLRELLEIAIEEEESELTAANLDPNRVLQVSLAANGISAIVSLHSYVVPRKLMTAYTTAERC